MNHSFRHQGVNLLNLEKEYRARRAALKKSIRAKYADEFSKSGLFKKVVIHWRIHRELVREWKKVAPSIHALY